MLHSPSFRTLFVGYSLVTVSVVVTAAAVFAGWIERNVRQGVIEDLRDHAVAIRELAVVALQSGPSEDFQQSIRLVGGELATRLTVLDKDGIVLADSAAEPSRMDNHSDRPEVCAARVSDTGTATRRSGTLERPMIYFAIRVPSNDGPLGFVRSSVFAESVDSRVADARTSLVFSSCFAVLLGLVPAAFFARRNSRPIDALAATAESIADGEFECRTSTSGSATDDGVARLGQAINRMARELLSQKQSRARGQVRLLTVLSSMIEGVVVVDRNERVIHCNRAAKSILKIRDHARERCFVWELSDVRALAKASELAVRHERDTREDLELPGDSRPRYLSLNGSPVRSPDGEVVGGVFVLHDLTSLRLLEIARRDFVANVSHELRTPVAAIRAMTETVLEDPELDKPGRARFLERVLGQCQRLSALVTDLLTLARLEADPGETQHLPVDMSLVVEEATIALRELANAKSIELQVDMTGEGNVSGDFEALYQVVKNLLDNAIQYTPDGGTVAIRLRRVRDRVLLDVEDTGIGIPREDLDRVFERFYRVDKGRSRELGGTGLGLAIVKHIVHGHNGSVSASSEPGKGSMFRVDLPGLAREQPIPSSS